MREIWCEKKSLLDMKICQAVWHFFVLEKITDTPRASNEIL